MTACASNPLTVKLPVVPESYREGLADLFESPNLRPSVWQVKLKKPLNWICMAALVVDADSLNLRKFLSKQHIARYTLILKALCLLCAALCAAWLIYEIISAALEGSSAKLKLENEINPAAAVVQANAGPNAANPDYSPIVKRSIFGKLEEEKTPTPSKPEKKPQTQLALTLIGTFVSDPASSYAIIEDDKKNNQDVFMVDDSVFDDATLVGIYTDRVELKRSGKIETLLLDDTPSGAVDTKGGVGQVDENEFVIDEGELDSQLENLPLLLTQARAVPYFKDGKSVGLRLFAIKNGSLFEKLGLKNGDILKSINGNSLGDISQAMQLFERLKQERSLSLVLERNRNEKTYRYSVQ